MLAHPLDVQCRLLAEGTRMQKRRAWRGLTEYGGFWAGCREGAASPGAFAGLTSAYCLLEGEWDRGPLVELPAVGAERLPGLLAGALRLLATAAFVTGSREGGCGAALAPWLWRAVDPSRAHEPLSWLPPLLSARHADHSQTLHACFRMLADTAGAAPALAAAHNAALTWAGHPPDWQGTPVRVPLLLARESDGYLAWLWLEPWSRGFGQLFQAPGALFDPLGTDLIEAVEGAVRHLPPEDTIPPEADVRWWITDLPAEADGSPVMVVGSSVEAAAAAGLQAVLVSGSYAGNCVVSARLAPDGSLLPVEGFTGAAPKLRAAQQLAARLGSARVFVSPANALPDVRAREWVGRGVEVRPAATLAQLVRRVSGVVDQDAGGACEDAASTTVGDAGSEVWCEPGGVCSRDVPVQDETLPPPTGVVPLDSPYYVVRDADAELYAAIARRDSIVRIKGARQMGKTSLLARGLQRAREQGAVVLLTDFQLLNSSHFSSAETFLLAVARWIFHQAELNVSPDALWDPLQGANWNFRELISAELMARVAGRVVWAIDEVDRLFSCPFASDVFALFRTWHNERALNPAAPWSRLTLVLSYATEAHLFLADLNQSPFNVGTRLSLQDFTPEQVADLNARYGAPVSGPEALGRLHRLLGGHPYLTHRALYEMARRRLDSRALAREAERDDGLFGDHLRRMLQFLTRDPALLLAVRTVLRGEDLVRPDAFYRLWSAGVLSGDSHQEARFRCELYAAYLHRHLP